MLYAEPAFALASSASLSNGASRPSRPSGYRSVAARETSRDSAPSGRDRESRQERWGQRFGWTDLLATTELEWRKRLAPRAADGSKPSAAVQPEALFCRFEVDNVLDR